MFFLGGLRWKKKKKPVLVESPKLSASNPVSTEMGIRFLAVLGSPNLRQYEIVRL